MKVQIEKTVAVKLELTLSQARWLKNIMQNPLFGDSLEEELNQDAEMRKVFWDALSHALPK